MRESRLRSDRMPRHVAIIMDGNGRWAQSRGLPRVEGHRAGVAAVAGIVQFVLLAYSPSEQLPTPEDRAESFAEKGFRDVGEKTFTVGEDVQRDRVMMCMLDGK